MTFVVGLTGGIGSGKSAVAHLFQNRGIQIVDSDLIAHELTAPHGGAMKLIRDAFGSDFLTPDGALDRRRMREHAFQHPEARKRLEGILHPMIREESTRRTIGAQSPYVIQVIPLLVETGATDGRFSRILVVDCPVEMQIQRVIERNGLTREEVVRIMQAQATRETRLSHATDVILNDSSLDDLVEQVDKLHAIFLACANGDEGLVNRMSDGRQLRHPTPKVDPVLIDYEYPLTERIRTLLRLEDLFDRIALFIGRDDPADHHVALLTLFEILEVAGRADLKSDLLQELERQKQVLLSFKTNPDVAQEALQAVIVDVERALASLFGMTGKIGQYLRENEWLMSIKQRTSIPGGACEFDLPSYHYWLNRDPIARGRDMDTWVSPLYPLRDGTAIVLKLLRESGKSTRFVAPQGIFSQMLGGRTSQMVRIRLARAANLVPEISANKYALNVRFTAYSTEPRPKVAEGDVEFELAFCNL